MRIEERREQEEEHGITGGRKGREERLEGRDGGLEGEIA